MKKNLILSALVIGALTIAPVAFAGNASQSGQSGQCGQSQQSGQSGQSGQSSQAGQVGQSGQSGQSDQCGQHQGGCHQKPGFFKKVGDAFKKGFENGKKAGTKAFDAVQNKVMDAGVSVKKSVTGKKCKTFVKGHYNSDGSHTKGHFRKVCKGSCKK